MFSLLTITIMLLHCKNNDSTKKIIKFQEMTLIVASDNCLQENITSRWDMHCMSATGTSNNIASTTGDISLDNCFIMWSLRADHYTCADVA